MINAIIKEIALSMQINTILAQRLLQLTRMPGESYRRRLRSLLLFLIWRKTPSYLLTYLLTCVMSFVFKEPSDRVVDNQ